MRRLILGVLLALVVAAPVLAVRPVPRCTVTAIDSANMLVEATGLKRGVYWAWWSVAHVDDGTPFYYAGTSTTPSDGRTWTRVVPTFGRAGYVYLYVVPDSAYGPFNPANAAAVCETVTS